MILFDSSVIIDARDANSRWHEWAEDEISKAVGSEGAGANTVVISEASVRAKNPDAVPQMLLDFGMTLIPLPISAAIPATKAFLIYLDRLKAAGKKADVRAPLPDFLIGAHAHAEQMTLVTRDPERVAAYFPKVNLITPPKSLSSGTRV